MNSRKMAGESPLLKRQREEQQETLTLNLEAEEQQLQQQTLNNKRQKSSSSSSSSSSSYNQILSFLDEEEEKLTHQDLSSLITTLHQELGDGPLAGPLTSSAASESESEVGSAAFEEEVDDRERVFRHLLEASDDELGLPSRDDGTSSSRNGTTESSLFPVNGGDEVEDLRLASLTSFDGLWELEDEAANYYTLLQSELFMEGDDHGISC